MSFAPCPMNPTGHFWVFPSKSELEEHVYCMHCLNTMNELRRGPDRPTIDEYYLGIAKAVSARGECLRRKVGAVIVRDGSIMGTGFNGAPPGERSCLDGACPRATQDVVSGVGYAETGCVVIHAEVNAIIRAGRERCLGAVMYVTDECCESCAPLVRAAGIVKVVTPNTSFQ